MCKGINILNEILNEIEIEIEIDFLMKESQINKSFSLHILRSFSEGGVRSLLDFNDVGFPPCYPPRRRGSFHPRVGRGSLCSRAHHALLINAWDSRLRGNFTR